MDFYHFYNGWKNGRYFYEIIQDGYPCRPYFDLEFYKDSNQSINPINCFKDFAKICKDVFDECLKIKLEDSHFLVLDSTTEEKFSLHVILHLPNKLLFPSNVNLIFKKNYFI
jgi:hypothetical protein